MKTTRTYKTIAQKHAEAVARERRSMLIGDLAFEFVTGLVYSACLMGAAYIVLTVLANY